MNDEPQMTNDEGMTKSEKRNTSADESFWYNDSEFMVREEPAKPRVYDLEERTAKFGEAVIDFVKQIPQDAVTSRLISQLVGAATSMWRELCRSRRRGFKERISEDHWNLSQGMARNQAFSTHDRSNGPGIETAGSYALA